MQSWLEQARILSGLTVEDCCQALFQSANEYLSKEQNPGTLTLNEIRVLMERLERFEPAMMKRAA